MPVSDALLGARTHRYLALSGEASVRQLLGHTHRSRVPLWWIALVWVGDGMWRATELSVIAREVQAAPELLDVSLRELPFLGVVECVEQDLVSSDAAKEQARRSQGRLVVVTRNGRLTGIIRDVERSARDVGKGWIPGSAEPLGSGLLAESRPDGLPDHRGDEERFTDVLCPRRVWCGTTRFPLVVRLTCRPRDDSVASHRVWVEPGEVEVVLCASGLQIMGTPRRSFVMERGVDSEAVTFFLVPGEPGDCEASLDFFQQGHHLTTIVVPVRVTRQPVEEESRRAPAVPVGPPPAVAAPDRVLLVAHDRKSKCLRFQLISRGSDVRDFRPVPLRSDPAEFVAGLFREILGEEDLFLALPPDEANRRLESVGRNLWSTLLADDLRELYREQREQWRDESLLVLSDEPHLPWEMVWPYGPGWSDEEPWCLSLLLSRWLRRGPGGCGNEGAPGALPFRSLASVAPRSSGLPAARAEAEYLRQIRVRHALRDSSPSSATWADVMGRLEAGDYDWFHVAAHGTFRCGRGGAFGVLALEDDQLLTHRHLSNPRIEDHLRSARPGFVLNACECARLGWGLTGVSGWAESLVSAGAGFFVAPLWAVGDRAARRLVETMYEKLLDGVEVAEAFREARRAARSSDDVTWLAYNLYAHPHAKLQRSG